MTESRTVVDIIDADGCIYNVSRYFPLVLWLCSHYGELDLTPKILPELEASLSEFMKRDFAEANFNSFHARCAYLQRQHVLHLHGVMLAQYAELGIDISDPDIQKEIDTLYPLDRPAQFYVTAYLNNCIEKFNQVDPLIMNKICQYANDPLLTRMKGNAKQGDDYYVAVGSLRQGYGHDRAGMRINSTNSVFTDLAFFGSLLRQHHGEEGARAAFYPLLLTDVQNSLIRGENMRCIISQLNGEHNSYFCDSSKILILYALIHDVVANSNTPYYLFNFYDNEIPLLSGLMKVFGEFPHLLPARTILKLHGYDGDFRMECELRGTGPIDRNYRQNSRLLLNRAIEGAGELEKNSVSVAKSVDFNIFLAERDIDYDPIRILAVGIDADDCLYNKKFVDILRFVLGTMGKDIEDVLQSNDDSQKSEVALKVMNEMNYVVAANAHYSHDWYKSLEVTDSDIHAAIINHKKRLKKHFAVQCQYLRYMRQLNPHIITHLLYISNKNLFKKMVASAQSKKCDHVEFYNISVRQCHEDDDMYAIMNGVGLINQDLPLLADFLNISYASQNITFGHADILMPDLYSRSYPGFSLQAQNNRRLCDSSLLSVVYAFTHYAKNSIFPVATFECYSGNIRGIEALYTRLNEENNTLLLPAGLTLHLLAYTGNFHDRHHEIVGAGEVDRTLYDSIACMADLCDMDVHFDNHSLSVDMLSELNIATFIEKRKEQRSGCLQQFESLIQFAPVDRMRWRVPGFFSANENATATAPDLHPIRPPSY